MKISRVSLIFINLCICMFIFACSGSNSTSPVDEQEIIYTGECYDAPGVVLILFDGNTTDDTIINFVSTFDFEAYGDIYGHDLKSISVIVPDQTEEEWITILSQYELVVSAERIGICPLYDSTEH